MRRSCGCTIEYPLIEADVQTDQRCIRRTALVVPPAHQSDAWLGKRLAGGAE